MIKITITEALQEVKTATARIARKRVSVQQYLARNSQLRDPLEKEGGSTEFVRRERQGIRDLEERIVRIRTLIQRANQMTTLTVGSTTRTLAEWLNWRREIAKGQAAFLGQLAQQLVQVRSQATRAGGSLAHEGAQDATKATDVIVSISEGVLAREVEEMETTLGTLDGKLSLLNATVLIEVEG